MKTKIFLLLISVGVLNFLTKAQQLDLSNNIIGYQEPYSKTIGQTSDGQGNIVYWGIFKGALVIDKQVRAIGRGGEDMFVAITDLDGNYVKSFTFGSDINDFAPSVGQQIMKSIVASDGYAYIITRGVAVGASFETVNGNVSISDVSTRSVFFKVNLQTGSIEFVKSTTLTILNIFKDQNQIYFQGDLLTTTSYKFDGVNYNTEEAIPRNACFFLKTNLDGERIWMKLVQSTLSNVVLRIESVEFHGNGKFSFAFWINGQDFTVNKVQYAFPSIGQNKNYWLVSSDTELENFQVKLIYQQRKSGNGFQGISLGQSKSFFLFYFREPETYSYDQSTNFYQLNHVLLEIGENFELTRISQLTSFSGVSNSIRFTSIKADDNQIYFYGFLTGYNSSTNTSYPTNFKSINIFKEEHISFDLNGPSKTYLIKSDHSLTDYNIINLGDFKPMVDVFTSYQPIISSGRYFHFEREDENWNPWIISANNQILRGEMFSVSDKADDPVSVTYLDDGSRIVLGFASGYTMLDDLQDKSIIKAKTRKDLFILRIDSQNNLIWYKRLKSSFKSCGINSIKKIGNEIHLIANFFNSDTKYLGDFFKLDDKELNIEATTEIKNETLLFVFEPNGIKEISRMFIPISGFPNLNLFFGSKSIIDENSYIEYTSSATNASLTINDKTFGTGLGSYFALVDRSVQKRLNVFKISVLNGPNLGFSVRQVDYNKSDESLLISLTGSFPLNSPNYVDYKIEFINGFSQTFRIDKYQLENSTLESTNYSMVLKLKGNEIQWIRQLGTMDMGVRAKFLTNGEILLFGTSRSKSLLFSEVSLQNLPKKTDVIAQSTIDAVLRNYILILSGNGQIIKLKYFDEFTTSLIGNNIISKLTIQNVKEINGDLYLIGSNNASFQIDNVEVGHLRFPDALIVQLSKDLVAKNIYRIASNYQDQMIDCDIFGDKISFIYSSQGLPQLVQGNATSQLNGTALPEVEILSGQANSVTGVNESVNTTNLNLDQINPSDKDENVGQGQFNVCKESTWFRDADGDGFGNKSITSINCEKPVGYVSNNFDCDDTESSSTPCPCPVRTFSQDWASNAISPLTDAWFNAKYPNGLVVGDKSFVNNYVRFTNAESIRKFISNSNQIFVLTTDYINPTSKQLRNNLVNQLLFLDLNMSYNLGLKRSLVAKGQYSGKTVLSLFEEASKIVGAVKYVSKSELSSITDAIESINASYESGKQRGIVVCETGTTDPSWLLSKNVSITTNAETASGNNSTMVYPNPSRTHFIYKSTSTIEQTAFIYNSVGQLMDRVIIKPNLQLIFGGLYRPGLYYIHVVDDKSKKVFKIIKE
jgi:hypothetical protein